jgi:N-ethylmaleimide reductase
MHLFQSYALGPITLRNRVVMAPMTRNRTDSDHRPTPIMAEYYAQRASMGLIITEGTSPSPNGLGYPRMPGLVDDADVAGWRAVTDAVHAQGGHIFVQLMHTGRASHAANLPAGAEVVGPMAEAMPGEIWTDALGMQAPSTPRALAEDEIPGVVEGFAQAARRAITAGFDGVELHGANGYLIEQFLNANVNRREDGYGGSAAARNRLALEITRAVAEAIGADRVGIRLSPYGTFNGTGDFEGLEAQYVELVQALGAMEIAYLHLVNHSSMGAPALPGCFVESLRTTFGRTFIASGGFDRDRAEEVLSGGHADLVAFGRPALANPDLVERFEGNHALNSPDFDTFYTPGAKGYTDYPTLVAV